MRLILDTDYLLRVEHWGIAEIVLGWFELTRESCHILEAAPYMLRKKKELRKKLAPDDESCKTEAARISEVSEQYLKTQGKAPQKWIAKMLGVQDIDQGEALLLAYTADGENIFATNDLRALKAIALVDGLASVLQGRILTPHATLLRLCQELGETKARALIKPRASIDTAIDSACCGRSMVEGLESYFASLKKEVPAGILWQPTHLGIPKPTVEPPAVAIPASPSLPE